MKLTVLNIKMKKSKLPEGGVFYYLFAKGEDGKSYFTCLYPKFGNFKRWEAIVKKGAGAVIDNILIKNNRLIDADSFPKIVE